MKCFCRPKAQEKQHFGSRIFIVVAFYINTVTIILDNYPPSTFQEVGLGGRKNPRIIVGEDSCHFSGKKKAHKRKLFGLVALGTTPGLSQGQTGFVPGTNPLCPRDKPWFLLILHSGSPVCPRDKPSLSLGQSQGRRAA